MILKGLVLELQISALIFALPDKLVEFKLGLDGFVSTLLLSSLQLFYIGLSLFLAFLHLNLSLLEFLN